MHATEAQPINPPELRENPRSPVTSTLGLLPMTLSTFEVARIKKTMNDFIEKIRPPAHIRDQLDFVFHLTNQSVELFEVRPLWRNPNEKTEQPVAKATFTKNQDIWKVYWHRADGKWHRYEPHPEAKTLDQFLSVVKKDEYGCFFG